MKQEHERNDINTLVSTHGTRTTFISSQDLVENALRDREINVSALWWAGWCSRGRERSREKRWATQTVQSATPRKLKPWRSSWQFLDKSHWNCLKSLAKRRKLYIICNPEFKNYSLKKDISSKVYDPLRREINSSKGLKFLSFGTSKTLPGLTWTNNFKYTDLLQRTPLNRMAS